MSLYPPVLTARFGFLNHVPGLLCSASNNPRSISICVLHLPLKHSGTRHEYRQMLPHPYSKLPTATNNSNGFFTDSSQIKTKAANILYKYFLQKPIQKVKSILRCYTSQFVWSFFTLHRMSRFIRDSLERPEVNINEHPAFAFEILWYLPQVLSASSASAILEAAGFKDVLCFINYFNFRFGNGPVVFC